MHSACSEPGTFADPSSPRRLHFVLALRWACGDPVTVFRSFARLRVSAVARNRKELFRSWRPRSDLIGSYIRILLCLAFRLRPMPLATQDGLREDLKKQGSDDPRDAWQNDGGLATCEFSVAMRSVEASV